jgi:threonine 3-dehydrogenase
MQDVPVPEPGLNDVIIKVKKSAICGTDLHIYEWDSWAQKTIKTPMTIGHEYMGYIAEMGAGVTNLKIGDRVTGEGHLACGHCRNCRRGKEHVCENTVGIGVHIDGSFAEYVKVPSKMLFRSTRAFPMNGHLLWILSEMQPIRHSPFH